MPKQFISLPVVYIITGLYRTIHDTNIRVPVWVRANAPYSMKSVIAVAGQATAWIDARTGSRINICISIICFIVHPLIRFLKAVLTFHIQRGVISLFLSKYAPRFFAFVRVSLAFRSSTLTNALYVPYVTQYLSVTTWATLVSLSSQMGGIVEFFLSKNIRIARDRAWDLTIISRGKSRDFWGPYVEEWQKPPKINETSGLERIFGKWWARLLFRRCEVHLWFG